MSALLKEDVEYVSAECRIPMRRVWAMPSSRTFDIGPIRGLVKKYLDPVRRAGGVSVDPFARNKRWCTHTNDLNPDTAAEHHLYALDFLKTLRDSGVRADLVLFDPPYSLRQAKEIYEGIGLKFTHDDSINVGHWQKEKNIIDEIVNPGGVVICFGWNSIGMGQILRGYEIQEILLVSHGRAHNDTICTVERERGGVSHIPPSEVADLVMATRGERINYDLIGKVLAAKMKDKERVR